MSPRATRRANLKDLSRAAALAGMTATAAFLVRKAEGRVVWQIDTARCVNSRAGEVGVKVCDLCLKHCVVTQSAVRAVNEYAQCGRCNICPAYFNVTSAVSEQGLPSEKLCPRDAIARKPIGEIDSADPANNFYEYIIDEARCDGCGKCVMACKEPAGLGSIRLVVRHNLCVDCNRCAISTACPNDALMQLSVPESLSAASRPAHAQP